MVSIVGSTNPATTVAVEALSGGKLDLSSVREIADSESGDTRGRLFAIKADGVNSRIELNNLERILDRSNIDYFGSPGISTIAANNSAVVQLSSTQTALFNVTTSNTSGGQILGNFGLRTTGASQSLVGKVLDATRLSTLAADAIAAWTFSLPPAAVQHIQSLQFVVTSLPDGYLGYSSPTTIYVDDDAAGFGWFIDETASSDEEFDSWGHALSGSLATGAIDLFTVVLHEIGHSLGLEHVNAEPSLMFEFLDAGVRKKLSSELVDEVMKLHSK